MFITGTNETVPLTWRVLSAVKKEIVCLLKERRLPNFTSSSGIFSQNSNTLSFSVATSFSAEDGQTLVLTVELCVRRESDGSIILWSEDGGMSFPLSDLALIVDLLERALASP